MVGTRSNRAEIAKRASPLVYVSKNSPSVIFIHGDADTLKAYDRIWAFLAAHVVKRPPASPANTLAHTLITLIPTLSKGSRVSAVASVSVTSAFKSEVGQMRQPVTTPNLP
jgi:hypothetical protein